MPDIILYGRSNSEFTDIAKLLEGAPYTSDISFIYAMGDNRRDVPLNQPVNLESCEDEAFILVRASRQWLRKNGKDLWTRLKDEYAIEWSYIKWSPLGSDECPTWD